MINSRSANKFISFFHRFGSRLLTLILIAILLFFISLRHRSPAPPSFHPAHEYHFFLFNTPCHLQAWQSSESLANAAFRDFNQSLQLLHNTINFYDHDSELSLLNRQAAEKPFACSDQLWQIVLAAEEAFQLTEGTFDVTVGPLMQTWGFHAKKNTMPTEEELTAAKLKVGFEKLTLDKEKHTVQFKTPGMQLDFGGMAKGHALDIGKEILEKHGLNSFLIDLGGNVLTSKKGPKAKQSFQIGIQNPEKQKQLETILTLNDACVATSGNYQRFKIIEGQKVGHVMNPKTGKPADEWAAVTVKTKKGVHSDVFSTAVFVGGQNLAEKLTAQIPETGFLLLKKTSTGQLERVIIGDLKLQKNEK